MQVPPSGALQTFPKPQSALVMHATQVPSSQTSPPEQGRSKVHSPGWQSPPKREEQISSRAQSLVFVQPVQRLDLQT